MPTTAAKGLELEMVSMRGQQDLAGAAAAAGPAGEARPWGRRGARVVLLSLAAAIVLLGAVTAGVYGYLMITRGAA
jgi:hypothetical protein